MTVTAPSAPPPATAAERHVVLESVGAGWRIAAVGAAAALLPDAAEFAAEVARLEAAGRPRWVWDTNTVYPLLLEHGVRVERAHDLRLARAILRRAVPGAFADLPLDGWDEQAAVDLGDALPLVLQQDAADSEQELRRQQAAVAGSPRPGALRLLIAAESAGALAAVEMRAAGLPWSRSEHERLLEALLGPRVPTDRRPAALEALAERIRVALHAPRLNPDSAVEVVRALAAAGLDVDSTRASTLRGIDHPVVAPLLEYKKLARLHQANGWGWLDTWIVGGRFRPDYVVGGVVTGRWATRGGGALQLPKQIRGAVVADPGWCLVVADAAQLEPRVLAGLAHDRAMADAGRGRDLYDGIVASGAVANRVSAKLGMLGALYGATSGEGGRLVPRLAQRFPRALALVERAAREGERGGAVRTLLGRTTPEPGAEAKRLSADAASFDADEAVLRRARAAARDRGRFTRNFVVQGTAAEWALCWLADLRKRLHALEPTHGARPHLVYFLHDEVIVHAPEQHADVVADAVREAATGAGRLLFGDFPVDFPLDVRIVRRYSDAA